MSHPGVISHPIKIKLKSLYTAICVKEASKVVECMACVVYAKEMGFSFAILSTCISPP